jgi:hypothetical protein
VLCTSASNVLLFSSGTVNGLGSVHCGSIPNAVNLSGEILVPDSSTMIPSWHLKKSAPFVPTAGFKDMFAPLLVTVVFIILIFEGCQPVLILLTKKPLYLRLRRYVRHTGFIERH